LVLTYWQCVNIISSSCRSRRTPHFCRRAPKINWDAPDDGIVEDGLDDWAFLALLYEESAVDV